MSEQLDYEATKAALRAQFSAAPTPHHGLSAIAWKWYGAASSLIVVTCAVILTVWATSGSSSVRLVPSGEHNGDASRSYNSTTSEQGTPVSLAAPLRPGQIITQSDGTVVTNVGGIPTAFITAGAAQAAAVQELSRVSRLSATTPPAQQIADIARVPVATQTRGGQAGPSSPPNTAPPITQPAGPATPSSPAGPTTETAAPTSEPTTAPTSPTTVSTPDPTPGPGPGTGDPTSDTGPGAAGSNGSDSGGSDSGSS